MGDRGVAFQADGVSMSQLHDLTRQERMWLEQDKETATGIVCNETGQFLAQAHGGFGGWFAVLQDIEGEELDLINSIGRKLAARGELANHDSFRVHSAAAFAAAIARLKQIPILPRVTPNNTEFWVMAATWWFGCARANGGSYYGAILHGWFGFGLPDDGSGTRSRIAAERLMREQVTLPDEQRSLEVLRFSAEDLTLQNWSAYWMDAGFAKVDVGARTAAAFMLTDAKVSARLPWPACSIIVPPGLCDPVRRVWCANSKKGEVTVVGVVTDDGAPRNITNAALTKQQTDMLDGLVRSVALAGQNDRLVGPAHRNAASTSRAAAASDIELRAEVWRISAPIDLDLRQTVSESWSGVSGSRSAPRVQFIVRGHWRNQVCGPSNSQRRMQWVEPYWKGPEGTVALLRRVQ